MGSVLRFHGHHWQHCGSDCEGCHYCSGGLAMCTVCLAAEGQLTEDCPGRIMTEDEASAVYAGELDYRVKHGGWTTWTRAKELHNKGMVT